MVAGAGFEPHDLRVMSPTSYQTALPRDAKFIIPLKRYDVNHFLPVKMGRSSVPLPSYSAAFRHPTQKVAVQSIIITDYQGFAACGQQHLQGNQSAADDHISPVGIHPWERLPGL